MRESFLRRWAADRTNLTRICLTGGACAGKTTALAILSQDLQLRGYNVLLVPEAATMLMKGGAMICAQHFKPSEAVTFQKHLLKLQVALEDTFTEIGLMMTQTGRQVVVLCDRGLMDGSAYITGEQWQAVVDDLGLNSNMLKDNRYEAVIHLVTAADGAAEFYEFESNEARYDTLETARVTDKKLKDAYIDHHKWVLIDNAPGQGFDEKMARTRTAVHEVLGIESSQAFYKKYLLRGGPQLREAFRKGEQTFISEDFIEYQSTEGSILYSSIAKKGKKDSYTYTHEICIEKHGQTFHKKRNISAHEYLNLMEQRKAGSTTLHKNRVVVEHEGVLYVVDSFPELPGTPSLLRVDVSEEKRGRVEVERHFEVAREVTDQPAYQSLNMAKCDYRMPEEDLAIAARTR